MRILDASEAATSTIGQMVSPTTTSHSSKETGMCEREGVCQFIFLVNMQGKIHKNILILHGERYCEYVCTCCLKIYKGTNNLPTLVDFSLIPLYHSFCIKNNKACILISHRQKASSSQSHASRNVCLHQTANSLTSWLKLRKNLCGSN